MSDHPFDQVALAAEAHVRAGATIHQKFTCARCGARQTIEEGNRFFTHGTCEECGHTTDIVAQGCNFLLIRSRPDAPKAS